MILYVLFSSYLLIAYVTIQGPFLPQVSIKTIEFMEEILYGNVFASQRLQDL